MKNKTFVVFTCLMSFFTLVGTMESVSNVYATTKKNVSGVGFSIQEGTKYTVTFYQSYSSSWGGSVTRTVSPGNTISNIPTPTVSGYTLQGWKTSAPTASPSGISTTYTTSSITTLRPSSDMTLYPIFKSNVDYAYESGNYYQANTDVTISKNSIGVTTLGRRYLGVTGIPMPDATWDSNRSLYSASGTYKFVNEGGGAQIYRKIGFKPNSSWGASWDGNPGFGIYAWDGNGNDISVHMGAAASGQTLYGYIPATFINFKFSRYSHNQSSFTWGNESGNLSFDNSWWWNGSGSNKYTSSTKILSMNSWGSWVDNWGSDKATWVAS